MDDMKDDRLMALTVSCVEALISVVVEQGLTTGDAFEKRVAVLMSRIDQQVAEKTDAKFDELVRMVKERRDRLEGD